MPVFPGPVRRQLHFPKLNCICHFSDHLTNLSMSSCHFCLSPISLFFMNSLVSSANFNMLPVTPSSKSSMYTKNKIGPSTDPWGTPLKTDFQLETSPSTTTLCLLSVSHCSIQYCLHCFPYHVILTWVLVFDVELYQMLSGNPNRLHLPMSSHPPIWLFPKKT